MRVKSFYLLIGLAIQLVFNVAQNERGVMKVSSNDQEKGNSIVLNKLDSCLVLTECEEEENCKAQISHCRTVYCSENTINFQYNQFDQQNAHANCLEFCLNKLFSGYTGKEILSYLECMYSKNDRDGLFIHSGYKSQRNYFGSYKPKIVIGYEAVGVSQFVEEFFIKKMFDVVPQLEEKNGSTKSNNSQSVLIKWNIEDEVVETKDHCSFIKTTQIDQKIHHRKLYQINHPTQYSQLITRKDCLKKMLNEFDELIMKSCQEQDDEDKDNQEGANDKKCVLLFSSKHFLLKSYYINTKKDTYFKQDDSQKIIDGTLQHNSKFVLKPIKGNYGSGLKFVRNFEDFRQKFLQMTKKNSNLMYKEYILEEFLENQLLIGDGHNLDLSFYVSILSTFPTLVFAKKGYVRVNGYKYDTDQYGNQYQNNVFNSRYFEVVKSGELKAIEVENIFYSFEEFFEILKTEHRSTDQINEHLIQKCHAIITYTIQAYINSILSIEDNPNILNKFADFTILRFDFLINNQMNPFLIEVENNALNGEYMQNEKIDLTQFLEDTVDYVHKLNLSSFKHRDPETTLRLRKRFIIKNPFEDKNTSYTTLINDAADFLYITDVFEI